MRHVFLVWGSLKEAQLVLSILVYFNLVPREGGLAVRNDKYTACLSPALHVTPAADSTKLITMALFPLKPGLAPDIQERILGKSGNFQMVEGDIQVRRCLSSMVRGFCDFP